MNPWLVLFGLLTLCLGVGGIGGFATSKAVVDWYPTLNKPSWNPPSWLFGPVWTTLYVAMAVAAWLVWRKGTDTPGVKLSLTLFALQLVLNGAWSLLFFGARAPGIAFAEILLMLAAILATTWSFSKLSTPATVLMIPYIAWVSFATFLNFTIWRLNPSV